MRRLRGADRRAPGTCGHRRAGVIANATGCLEVATTIYPYSAWKLPWIHSAFENAAATISGVEAMFKSLKRQGKTPGGPEDKVHRVRRRRRHVRHRASVPLRRAGARARLHVRLLRQRRVHEHRHPAQLRDPVRRGHHHLARGQSGAGQDPEAQGPDEDRARPRGAVRGAGLAS